MCMISPAHPVLCNQCLGRFELSFRRCAAAKGPRSLQYACCAIVEALSTALRRRTCPTIPIYSGARYAPGHREVSYS